MVRRRRGGSKSITAERRVVSLGVIGVGAWVLIFAGGILLDSKPYRDELLGKTPSTTPSGDVANAAGAKDRVDVVRLVDGTIVTSVGAGTTKDADASLIRDAGSVPTEDDLSSISMGRTAAQQAAVLADGAGAEGAVNLVRLPNGAIVTTLDAATPARTPEVGARLEVARIHGSDETLPPVSMESASGAWKPKLRVAGHGLLTFTAATWLFAPLNAVVLALLAALAGGCASWLAHKDDVVPPSATAEERTTLEEQLRTWKENPLGAMFRGFAVYLAVIAGVYVTGGDPFPMEGAQAMRADQYIRFAGTVSLLSFVVGYDPNRLRMFIDSVPGLGRK